MDMDTYRRFLRSDLWTEWDALETDQKNRVDGEEEFAIYVATVGKLPGVG